MNGLDSPVEALTFIPVNLGTLISAVTNNLWAWLAVITATLSLWRLRITTFKTTSSLISLPPPPPPPPTTPTKPTSTTTRTTSFKCMGIDESKQKQEEEEGGVLARGNSKKFFTVYLEEREDDDDDHAAAADDDDEMMEGGDDEEVEENEPRVVMIKRWGSSSELMVEMRGGNFGWYSYQNRKVIDGSVVRLWDEERENGSCGSPRSFRSRRTASSLLVLA